MTLRPSLATATVVLLALATPRSAFADLTAFIGATTTPVTRPAKGFAVGAGLLIVGFEFEYANSSEDLTDPVEPAAKLQTFMFNGLVQTPFAIAGFQPYATAGGGAYRESVSVSPLTETSFGTNIGGGVKISLAGPLRLRVDYRVFNLRGTPTHNVVQRVYAGVNLKF